MIVTSAIMMGHAGGIYWIYFHRDKGLNWSLYQEPLLNPQWRLTIIGLMKMTLGLAIIVPVCQSMTDGGIRLVGVWGGYAVLQMALLQVDRWVQTRIKKQASMASTQGQP